MKLRFEHLLLASCLIHAAVLLPIELDEPKQKPAMSGAVQFKLAAVDNRIEKQQEAEEPPPSATVKPEPTREPKREPEPQPTLKPEPTVRPTPKPLPEKEQTKKEKPREQPQKRSTAKAQQRVNEPPERPKEIAKPKEKRVAKAPAQTKEIKQAPRARLTRSELVNYQSTLLAWLERHKRYPRAARRRGIEGEAIVLIKITREGRVLHSVITRSANNTLLDREVREMIVRANPFPPMPPKVSRRTLAFQVPIRFRLR